MPNMLEYSPQQYIVNNYIGKILHFEYHISSPRYQYLQNNKLGWLGDRMKFGGMLGALGTHMVDCLRWLVKDEMEDYSGFVHTHVSANGIGTKGCR
ncbi:Gfo/Idh/MocA family protein [Oceanobacillus neutriphilus]|uniref:GFO/IDH/MocA-like oxidoreductase domain-containing protein n=1 Tax=Oceanobacillus neutriphilus TaxID=531815 RepID=A0ABQ2NUL9_9BACI|nr:Gfo/Idh/MocA family oxidoreductase [Oceanobacillus neutriphilus]GGP10942.1 hypothetical protein GCM10011346_21070 [Oceanobacillus neutriphilus]